jgi:dimethylhistidine N-methyltransferase
LILPGKKLNLYAQQSPTQTDQSFLDDVIKGFSRESKALNCKYFYDERGSQLFDQICELDEYYLTRTEQAVMDRHIDEMVYQIGEQVMLIEFGSGSSVKTQTLLEALHDPVAYVPIDISEDHLLKTAETLQSQYPGIEILPVVADFTMDFDLPRSKRKPSHAAVYFPGSTIGNFEPDKAGEILARFSEMLGPEGGLLIGIDLQKDPAIIHAAYNDASGITAEFNLNLLHRINSELDADINVDKFEHLARYNQQLGRVEIYVVSTEQQTVYLDGREFEFAENEKVFTEYSHKYTIEGFAEIAAEARFSLHKSWTDDDKHFALLHLVNERGQ